LKAALKKTAKPSNSSKTKCKATNSNKGQFHAKKRKRVNTTATTTAGTKKAVKGSSAGVFAEGLEQLRTSGDNHADGAAADNDGNGMDIDDIILSSQAKRQKRDA
jgi:hypothetical protein